MNRKGQAFAILAVVLFLILVALTVAPSLKETLVEVINAAK